MIQKHILLLKCPATLWVSQPVWDILRESMRPYRVLEFDIRGKVRQTIFLYLITNGKPHDLPERLQGQDIA
jgi:hypothetical protein